MTLDYPLWKKAVIFVVLVFGLLYSLPNVYRQDPAVQVSASRNAVLDDTIREKVQGDLERAKIAFKSIEIEDKRLLVRLVSDEKQLAASELLRNSLGENYTVALNLGSTVPGWLAGLGGKPMVLGLDLQGGVHFVLQVDQKAALQKRVDSFAEDVRATLRDNRIPYQGVEVRPGNTKVVHHSLNFFDASGTARELEKKEAQRQKKDTEQDRGPGYSVAMGIGFTPSPGQFGGLGGWAPGQRPRFLPDGYGYPLPKGSDVVLQLHYHRNGRVEKDRTSIGLYFAKKGAEVKPYKAGVVRGNFLVVPPGRE